MTNGELFLIVYVSGWLAFAGMIYLIVRVRPLIIKFFNQLLCCHQWSDIETYRGFEMMPGYVNGGFPALKQRRICSACGKVSIKVLHLL